jgi:Sec7-like guanine-nucleotide exchange factor
LFPSELYTDFDIFNRNISKSSKHIKCISEKSYKIRYDKIRIIKNHKTQTLQSLTRQTPGVLPQANKASLSFRVAVLLSCNTWRKVLYPDTSLHLAPTPLLAPEAVTVIVTA